MTWFCDLLSYLCCCCGSKKVDKPKISDQKMVSKRTDSRVKKNKVADSIKRGVSPQSRTDAADTQQELGSFYGTDEQTDENKPKTKPVAMTRYFIPSEDYRNDTELLKYLGYELKTYVGKGGFGTVNKCIHSDKSGSKKVMACKMIPLIKDRSQKGIKSEIEVLTTCKHPYIIELFDHFLVRSGDTWKAYLFMEFADGGTLEDEIRSRTLTEELIKRYFIQITFGLTYLHLLKFAHKDLKPENILLVKNPDRKDVKDVRLGDFGLSENVYDPKEGIIRMGHFGGTRPYMAPEILKYDAFKDHRKVSLLRYDPFRSDIWALGVILYEMFHNKVPYDISTVDPLNPLEQFKPLSFSTTLNSKARDLITKLLEPEVPERIDVWGILSHDWIKDQIDLKSGNVRQIVEQKIELRTQ